MNFSPFKHKKIILGVCGSIAAYKAADVVRQLQDAGAQVRVVMTRSACKFMTPLTMQALSGHPVALELLDADQESAMGHITLARWADAILIAPASANTLAKLAQGIADDLLTALCLASESLLALAPAMNHKMWTNSITQTHINQLQSQGAYILGPASGRQACGETGAGRLLEPADIVAELGALLVPARLTGKRVIVTAGPTWEPIDPVRFIANRSSGKMGFSMARAAAEAGAEVTLISGPVVLATPTGVTRIDVETARQMYDAVMDRVNKHAIFIACAAVADFKVARASPSKIKKTEKGMQQLALAPTVDIVAAVAARKDKPFVVGFAAETHDVTRYAQDKLGRKKLDMIAANQVGQGKGFGVDDNALDVFWASGHRHLPMMPKLQLARQLMTLIIERYDAKNPVKNT